MINTENMEQTMILFTAGNGKSDLLNVRKMKIKFLFYKKVKKTNSIKPVHFAVLFQCFFNILRKLRAVKTIRVL